MKKQFIIKELNTSTYWYGFTKGEQFGNNPAEAETYDAEWKALDLINSYLLEKLSNTIDYPIITIIITYTT